MNRDVDSELSRVIQAQAMRYSAPPALLGSITAALNRAEPAKAAAPRKAFQKFWQQWGAMGATFASGLIVSFVLGPFFASQGDEGRLSREVVGGHVRSLMQTHLADVVSTDQHTVKPWFSDKLDFSPPVHDLAQQGFPLIGGRLDYLDQHLVAALVYRRQQHTINLFVWPSGDNSAHDVKLLSRQGFNITEWRNAGMQFWAVSDLGSTELQTFTQLLQQRLIAR